MSAAAKSNSSEPPVPSSAADGRIIFRILPDSDASDLYTDWSNPNGDSGVDIRFARDQVLSVGETTTIRFGIRTACEVDGNPAGYWLAARSSFTKTAQVLLLRNHMGTIDRGYRGEIMARVHNFGPGDYTARRGDSLFQLLEPLMRAPVVLCVLASDARFSAGATTRGAGGFGSTGTSGQGAAALQEAGQTAEGAPTDGDATGEKSATGSS